MLSIEFDYDSLDGQVGDFFTEAMGVGIPFAVFENEIGGTMIGFKTKRMTSPLNDFFESWFGSDYEEFLEREDYW